MASVGVHRRRASIGVIPIAALAMAACSSGGSEVGGGESSGDATTTSSPTAEVEGSTAASTEASDALVDDASAFFEAVAAGDREVAASFVDPKTLESGNGVLFGRAETLEGQLDWYDAIGWEWTFEGCEAGRGRTVVDCTATVRNPWSDAVGESPVGGRYRVRFGDDGIVSVDSSSFGRTWVPKVFSVFAQWVDEHYPDDAAVMSADVDVNEEILDVYAVNTARFAEAYQDG